MQQQYLKTFIFFLALLALPIGGNWLFLTNSGELLPIEAIVETQLAYEQDCIVGLATRDQGYYYKQAMYQRVKPDVLALGSSRVMPFRGAFFSAPMFNVGGAMGSVNEGFSFIREAFAVHVPKVVILGIDYWWFNEGFSTPTAEIKPPLPLSHRISLRSYLLPYKWLWQKKITFSQYVERLNPWHLVQPIFDQGIGVDGSFNKNGFAADGSYFYTKYVVGKEKSIDIKFQHNLELVSNNYLTFQQSAPVNALHFQIFLNMLAFLKQHQVQVILFIPPLAPTIIDHMKQFSYLEELRRQLKQANLSYYDFHDPRVLHASDCEFIDGIHGGDVLYAKILRAIAQHEPTLEPYLNVSYLDRVAQQYRDLAMIPQQKLMQGPEIDFLQIGCNKSNPLVLGENR